MCSLRILTREVYTQIYVQAPWGTGSDQLQADAYDSLIERVQERVEGIEAERCQVRYDEIVEEATDVCRCQTGT